MVTLVIGGADSGKSEYAEQLLLKESVGVNGAGGGSAVERGADNGGGVPRIYIATMPATKEAKARIKRHVERRAHMGFDTIEYLDDGPLALFHDAFVLFEDLPNYVADIMFAGLDDADIEGNGGLQSEDGKDFGSAREISPGLDEDFSQTIENRINLALDRIIETCSNIIFVTGDLCSAGFFYEKEVTDYLKVLGHVQQHLAKRADRVLEVVAGVAVAIK